MTASSGPLSPSSPRSPSGRALPPGWVRVDCHLHTAASGDAVTTLDQLAERVASERLDVVCVTDHNVMSAARSAAERGVFRGHALRYSQRSTG